MWFRKEGKPDVVHCGTEKAGEGVEGKMESTSLKGQSPDSRFANFRGILWLVRLEERKGKAEDPVLGIRCSLTSQGGTKYPRVSI